ncbi:hypothetical protein MG293_018718 [Ovis ammon polii]|uniref:Prolactin n=1 Tax=Ovis ammon polii TaxID=230172 RepID=A0AAD4XYK0_OVIAM|nr:hypothetical protein MG293_018718 [Ovis ammon polii]
MDSKGSAQKGSRLLLLLVVSNLLLCQGVVSTPVCPNGPGNCQVSLRDLFDRAVMVSHYIHNLSSEMFNEFVSTVFLAYFQKKPFRSFIECPNNPNELNLLDRFQDKRYAQGKGFITMALNSCHTSSLPTPEDKEQAQQTHHEVLMSLILGLLRSWNDPLYHLVTEVRGMKGVPDAILSRAIEIEEENKRLLEGMEMIFGQVIPGAKETEPYPVWSGLPSLQTKDEDARHSAFYNLLHCLRRDSSKIDTYLKLLNCRIIYNNNC